MWPLIVTVLLASLMGSLHCAGMCGAFVVMASTGDGRGGRGGAMLQCAYHAGRLVTYTGLGVVAGGVGAAVDFGGGLVGVQESAAVLAGVMMIIFGSATFLRLRGARLPRVGPPALLQRAVTAGHRAAFDRPPAVRALVIGLLTTLLPCGWLYAFVVVAAGTASPLWGGLVMTGFWVGTVPVLAFVGAGARRLAGRFAVRLPLVSACALVAVGLFTIMQRSMLPEPGGRVLHTEPVPQGELISHVRSISEQEPTCHDPG